MSDIYGALLEQIVHRADGENRYVGVDGMNHLTQCVSHRCWISIGFGDDRHPRLWMLAERQVKKILRGLKRRDVRSRYSHTDDFDPGAIAMDADPLTDRISVHEMLRKLFVYNGNRRR